jgi:hypothetical protein
MRAVAPESTRKCCPSLGLLWGFSEAAILVTLTRFPAGLPAFKLASSFRQFARTAEYAVNSTL